MTEVPAVQGLIRLERSTAFGAVLLVAANAVPLVGVLFLGWSVGTILILYWLENGIVGVFNVLRIRKEQAARPDATMTISVRSSFGRSVRTGHYFAPYFVLNYGIFWLTHGFFVLLLSAFTATDGQLPFSPVDLALGVICLAISQAGEYRTFVRRGDYRNVTPREQMTAPYGRLLVLHFTIIVGAFAIILTGEPVALVAALVVLKTVLDLVLYLRAHRGTAPAGAR